MKKMPVIELDMSLPPSERFARVPKRLLKAGATLAGRSNREIGSPVLQRLAEVVLDTTTAFRNPYRNDVAAWARLIGIRRAESLTANFAYEISQASSWGETVLPSVAALKGRIGDSVANVLRDLQKIRNSHPACTAGAAHYPKLGNVLVRAMDWAIDGLGRHSVLWRHTGLDAGDFISMGWPGYVGVVSGNAPGRFAATINRAPPVSAPFLRGWPPAHLLRWVFEHCADYEDALATLYGTMTCFPAFIMLVGTKPGEAAVVELTPVENRIHHMTGRKPIAIGNDYLSGDWRARFGSSPETLDPHKQGTRSEYRRNTMLRELKRRKPGSMERAMGILRTEPVLNESTVQQMIFNPRTGDCLVYGLEDEEPVSAGYVPRKQPQPKK